MFACIPAYMCVCVCVCVCVYVGMYVYIYLCLSVYAIHIHAHTLPWQHNFSHHYLYICDHTQHSLHFYKNLFSAKIDSLGQSDFEDILLNF